MRAFINLKRHSCEDHKVATKYSQVKGLLQRFFVVLLCWIIFCMTECSTKQLKSFTALFSKQNMLMVNRQSLMYRLGTSPLLLLFQPCRGITNKVAAHISLVIIIIAVWVSLSNAYIFASRDFAIIAVMLWRDITYESVPGYTTPFFISSQGVGEPGNEVRKWVFWT